MPTDHCYTHGQHATKVAKLKLQFSRGVPHPGHTCQSARPSIVPALDQDDSACSSGMRLEPVGYSPVVRPPHVGVCYRICRSLLTLKWYQMERTSVAQQNIVTESGGGRHQEFQSETFRFGSSKLFDFSTGHVRKSIVTSLSRIRCGYIDVLQFHDPKFAPSRYHPHQGSTQGRVDRGSNIQ